MMLACDRNSIRHWTFVLCIKGILHKILLLKNMPCSPLKLFLNEFYRQY